MNLLGPQSATLNVDACGGRNERAVLNVDDCDGVAMVLTLGVCDTELLFHGIGGMRHVFGEGEVTHAVWGGVKFR